MKKVKVWTVSHNRSEWGPLSPLIKLAEQRNDIEIEVARWKCAARSDDMICGLEWADYEPDIILCGFDRKEMPPIAYSAYLQGYPVAQIFAGDIAGGTLDDGFRFGISNYADILFCSTHRAADRVKQANHWRWELGQKPLIKVVGATHHDDMKAAEPAAHWMKKPFAVVLYNPPNIARDASCSPDRFKKEVRDCWEAARSYGHVVWVAPNGDCGSDIIKELVTKSKVMKDVDWMVDMPRAEYLTLLKNCKAVVGNSSSMFYEAPYFNKPIVQVGARNKYREAMRYDDCMPGASEKILSTLVKYVNEGGGRQ